jgi:NAD(P)-dependent dehydrogenase (short-subunit alcohol dehydrogenase family)
LFPRTALVTGGSAGIGAAVVDLLRREGADVQVLDIQDGFDVSDPATWDAVAPVELACLNAGVTTAAETVADYRRVVGTNVDGVVFGVRRMAEVMAPGSAIVVTASLAGLVPWPGDAVYTLTKYAVVGFVRAAAPGLAERGIRLNAVCPSFTATAMTAAEVPQLEEAGFKLMQPEQVAAAIVATARSEETGQAWIVQPGREPIRFRFPNVPGPR